VDATHPDEHEESAEVEREIRALGHRIFDLAGDESPSIFDSRWWSGKLLEWCIRDDAFKTAMFRFVDVYPMLGSTADVARHIEEYFPPDADLPAPLRWGVKAVTGPLTAAAAVAAVHKNIEAMAKRFIAGRTPEESVPLLRKLWDDGVAFSVDLLGEATLSEPEARRYRERYSNLFDVLAAAAGAWPQQPRLENASWGRLPRVNVSVKVSALHWHVDAVDFEGSVERVAQALLPIFHKARETNAFVNVDVEQHALKDITYSAFRRVLADPSLDGFDHAGIV
jgi:RHH-type proline utilization regulon transcriptional repressor/proline dehydrogenase/delta 1-pyrroline-5-carboxylate dehydrogenase